MFLSYSLSAAIAGEMTREEILVRTTYAKLSYAVEIRNLLELAPKYPERSDDASQDAIDRLQFEQKMAAGDLHFQISDVRVGNLSDIAKNKYSEFATKPVGQDAITAYPASTGFNNAGRALEDTEGAAAAWIKNQFVQEDWDVPVGVGQPIVEAGNGAKFSRYVACSVVVSLEGKPFLTKRFGGLVQNPITRL
jgi:hypothetical protein